MIFILRCLFHLYSNSSPLHHISVRGQTDSI